MASYFDKKKLDKQSYGCLCVGRGPTIAGCGGVALNMYGFLARKKKKKEETLFSLLGNELSTIIGYLSVLVCESHWLITVSA